jgi:hypothetical protein
MTINLDARRFWKWLTLYAYRRWSRLDGPARLNDGTTRKPVGVPGNRDPDHPCESYAPRPRQTGDWHDCLSDGHYLCAGCAHRDTSGSEGPAPLTWLTVSEVPPSPSPASTAGGARA